MSWFSSASSIDDKVEQATSESLPTGAQDLGLNLEICDIIRSKTVQPKDAMRSLKRRLLHKNPNVQIATLNLIDICIKNGGTHFLAEIASREFMDNFVLVLKPLGGKTVDPAVKQLMLQYLQNWAKAFEGQIQLGYVSQVYKQLSDEGFEFPAYDSSQMSASFIDSAAPPEWVDSDTCMISGTPFSFTNRKHHCRNCGGVFIQQYCNNYIALPHYGINTPVRVCDRCYEKLNRQKSHKDHNKDQESTRAIHSGGMSSGSNSSDNANANVSSNDDEDDMQKAIRLSLEEANKHKAVAAPTPAPASLSGAVDDEDEQMRLAIEASLKDIQGGGDAIQSNPNANSTSSNPLTNSLYQLPQLHQQLNQTPSYHSAASVPQTYISPQPSGGPMYGGPVRQPIDLDKLTDLEEDAINKYIQLVDDAERRPPQDILQNTQLQQLHESTGNLRPKLARNVRTTIDKCEALEEMHGKLTAVIRLYDKILDDRLAVSYRQSANNPGFGGARMANANQYGSSNGAYMPSAPVPGPPNGVPNGHYQYPPDQHSNSPLKFYDQPGPSEFAPPSPASANAPPSAPPSTLPSEPMYGSNSDYFPGAPPSSSASPPLSSNQGYHRPNMAPLSVQPQRIPSNQQLEPKEDSLLIEL